MSLSEQQSEILVEGPGIDIPDAIEKGDFDQSIVNVIADANGNEYDVFVFTPEDELPLPVAEWLRYRTFTENIIGAESEGDRYRFKDSVEIQNKFLVDQGGRFLFTAFDRNNGRLYGVSWLHKLQNDKNDFLLTQAGLKYLDRNSIGSVRIDQISTFATREYSRAIKKRMKAILGMLSVTEYFQRLEPDCKLIVGRYGDRDHFEHELESAVHSTGMTYDFKAIENQIGWVIYGIINPNTFSDVEFQQ